MYFGKRHVGVSFLDVSTGEYLTAQGDEAYIDKLLQNFHLVKYLFQRNKERFSRSFRR